MDGEEPVGWMALVIIGGALALVIGAIWNIVMRNDLSAPGGATSSNGFIQIVVLAVRIPLNILSNLELVLLAPLGWLAWAVWAAFAPKLKVNSLRSYGASRGLQPSPDSALRRSVASEQGILQGVFVMVTCSATNRDTWAWTRVAAAAPHQMGRIHVSLGGASWDNTHGLQDVEIGDPPLGRCCAVKSDSPDIALRWLTPALRREILALGGRQLSLSLADGQIALTWRGIDLEDVGALDQAMRIVVTAALGRAV